jgi:hypothetical protein
MGYLLSLSEKATSAGLEISEWGLLIAGLVLLIGIIGEYKLPQWHHRLKFFELLVLIGVLFELIFDGGVFLFSRQLQILEGAEIESLSTRSATALGSANTALTRASDATTKAQSAEKASGRAADKSGKAEGAASSALTMASAARQEADSFEKDIVSAKQQATEAEEHLADALKRVQVAEANTSQLRREFAPRRLTEEHKVELVRLLSSAPAFTVRFLTLRSVTEEVSDFTDDLMDVFVRMKLMAPGSNNRILNRSIGASDVRGVVIDVLSLAQHPPAADIFIDTLRKFGFECSEQVAPTLVSSATDMAILVGGKQ